MFFSLETVLPVSFQEWTCFYTGQSPGVRNPRAKSKGKICKVQSRQSPLGGMWGEAAAACKVWEELCDEVTEGWRLAIDVVMVGWLLEKEAGCKCCHCRACEENCPSGDEGGGGGVAPRCWSVTRCHTKNVSKYSPSEGLRRNFYVRELMETAASERTFRICFPNRVFFCCFQKNFELCLANRFIFNVQGIPLRMETLHLLLADKKDPLHCVGCMSAAGQ